MNLNIDIVDRCNLRCPSCPRGRKELSVSGQEMSPDALRLILQRAADQTKIHSIQLYDNCEPTLHSDLPAMIRTAKAFGFVEISTNASVPRVDWAGILAAGVDQITLSIGGATQSVAERNHVGVKMETVWSNARIIDNSIRWNSYATAVKVLYHRYLYNLHEEKVARKIVKDINSRWEFAPLWATQLFPFSDALAADGLVLDPTLARELCKRWPAKDGWCLILDQNLNMDCRGMLALCPGMEKRVGSFLTLPLAELQRARRTDPTCIACRATGFSHYVCREPHLDAASAKAVGDRWQYKVQRWRHWLFHAKERITR